MQRYRKRKKTSKLLQEIKFVVIDMPNGLELRAECVKPNVPNCGYRENGTCFALSRFDLFECLE